MSWRALAPAGFLCAVLACVHAVEIVQAHETPKCVLPENWKKEIHDHQDIVNQIIGNATNSNFYASKYYLGLQEFVDSYGGRLAGSINLENAIDHLVDQVKDRGIEVTTEPVEVPHWTRGNESAYLISPRHKKLEIIGLGTSEGTPPEGIIADVVVVKNFGDLNKLGSQVVGKIVLFNVEFSTYGKTVQYRSLGPSRASQLGAVAALVRSVTPFSINSPHTGATNFEKDVKRIPAAAVTLEDADLMARFYAEKKEVRIWLKMDAKLQGTAQTRNIIAEMPGSSLPDEYVLASGHIDSWDNGEGALDDGVGAFLALHTLYLFKAMNIPPPKRTVRAILWSGEELGLLGAKQYHDKHKNEVANWTAIFESDFGSSNPLGLNVEGNYDSWCIIKEIASMFKSVKATRAIRTTGVGSDISVFRHYGIPLLEPYYGHTNYFWYHHTAGDSMRTLNSKLMDKNLAIHAATVYVLANLTHKLPRKDQTIWYTDQD